MREFFTLKKLKVVNKNRTIFDVMFVNEKQSRESPLTTVIIGVNGAGKSYLLTIIAEVFRTLKSKGTRNDFNLKYDEYYLEYILNNNEYKIDIKKNNFNIVKNQTAVGFEKIEFPNKILAVSYMLNDKFVFKNSDVKNEFGYEYLGLRQASNAAWITSISKRVCNALINLSLDEMRMSKVKEILKFLGFEAHISVHYEANMKSLFKRNVSKRTLEGRINKYLKSEDFRVQNIKKFNNEDSIDNILDFINEIKNKDDHNIGSSADKRVLKYTVDFYSPQDNAVLKDDYDKLKLLTDLRMINSPKLYLYKNNEGFDFEYASSGEKHLLFTLLNIALTIEDNSIILIDEPELSLHPNWQMSYISHIKKLFLQYKNCHFICATHSHYIVSDLEAESSSLVVLESVNDKGMDRIAQLIEYNTYAWSAENILYNIFKVRTTRNFYFEVDLRELMRLIENEEKKDFPEIKKLIQKLSKYIYDKNDPLNLVLKNAKEYIMDV